MLRRIVTLVGPHQSADQPVVARAAALAERSGAALEREAVADDVDLVVFGPPMRAGPLSR